MTNHPIMQPNPEHKSDYKMRTIREKTKAKIMLSFLIYSFAQEIADESEWISPNELCTTLKNRYKKLRVNYNTLSFVLNELTKEGIIEKDHGTIRVRKGRYKLCDSIEVFNKLWTLFTKDKETAWSGRVFLRISSLGRKWAEHPDSEMVKAMEKERYQQNAMFRKACSDIALVTCPFNPNVVKWIKNESGKISILDRLDSQDGIQISASDIIPLPGKPRRAMIMGTIALVAQLDGLSNLVFGIGEPTSVPRKLRKGVHR